MPSKEIPKSELLVLLEDEAPHFLHTLMHLELPPMIGRLRLPVVTTASKREAEEANERLLEQFIQQRCERTPERHTLFAEFYERFQQWLPAEEQHAWSKKRVSSELPVRHRSFPGTDNKKFVANLTLKPAEEPKP